MLACASGDNALNAASCAAFFAPLTPFGLAGQRGSSSVTTSPRDGVAHCVPAISVSPRDDQHHPTSTVTPVPVTVK